MALENLLAAEPLIIARIKAHVPGLRTVASASVLAGAVDIAPMCPAAFVLSDLASARGTDVPGRAIEAQNWQVVICVASIRDPHDVNTTASVAGPFMLDAVKALAGWVPTPDHRAVVYQGRGAPYYEPGYGEFPLFFGVDVPLRGIG